MNRLKLIMGWTLLITSIACVGIGAGFLVITERHIRADKHYQHALVLREKGGSFKGIRSELKESIRLNRKHFDAHKILGDVYANSGRFQSSARAYREAYLINQYDIDVLFGLGDVNIKAAEHAKGEHKKGFSIQALGAYRNLFVASLEPARSRYGVGVAYRQLHTYKQAMIAFEQCISAEPESEWAEKAQEEIQKIRLVYDVSAGVLIITGTWAGTGSFETQSPLASRVKTKSEVKIEQFKGGELRGHRRWTDKYGGGAKESLEGTIDKERRITLARVNFEDVVDGAPFFFKYRKGKGNYGNYTGTLSKDGKTIRLKSETGEHVLKKR